MNRLKKFYFFLVHGVGVPDKILETDIKVVDLRGKVLGKI